jgi:Ankyrin repeats (3 copies)
MAMEPNRSGKAAVLGCFTAVGGLALGMLVVLVVVGVAISSIDWDFNLFGGDDDRNPELERAIDECDHDAVEAELEKGADQFDGGAFELFGTEGPTMEAAIACGPEITDLLTRYSVGNDGGDAVLQAAVATGRPELAAAALDAGADVDGQDDAGDTALLDAVTAGDLAVAQLLLLGGADPELPNEAGHTPLFRAVAFDHAEIVATLLDAGADPNASASITDTDVLGLMMVEANVAVAGGGTVGPAGHNVDRAVRQLGPNLGLPDSGPWRLDQVTVLYLAIAVSADDSSAIALLDAGADPTVGVGRFSHRPADAAELLGRTELAARIRAAGG